MKSTIGASVVTAALSLSLAACGGAEGITSDAAGVRVINFGCSPAYSGLPRMIAAATGIAKENDIKIVCSNIASGPEITAALVSGEMHTSQVTPGNLTPLLDKAQDMAAFAGFTNREQFQLVVRKGFNLPHAGDGWKGVIGDLAKAKIGVPALGGAAEFLSRGIVEKAGLPKNTGTLLATQQQAMMSSLESGQLDAAWMTEPATTVAIASGVGTQPFTIGGDDGPEGMEWGSLILIASRAVIEKEKEVFCALKTTYEEAIAYIANPQNDATTLQVIIDEMGLSKDDAETLLDRNREVFVQGDLSVDGSLFDPAFKFLNEVGLAAKLYTTDDYAVEVC